MRFWLPSLVTALALVVGTGSALADRNQASEPRAVADGQTWQTTPAVAAASREFQKAKDAHVALVSSAQKVLAEVDALKKQRAGFRRDRQLRDKLAASHAVTAKLQASAAQLRKAELGLRGAKLAALDVALANPSLQASARAQLVAARSQLVGGAAPKKIVVPPSEIDLTADPEELDAAAAALAQTERELTAQLAQLAKQETALAKAEQLAKQHARGVEVAIRDDDQARRVADTSGQRSSPEATGAASDPGNQDTNGAPPSGFDQSAVGPSLADVSIVLADVVDRKQADALRAAANSRDPAVQAQAVRSAKAAVAANLAKLQQARAAIVARAQAMRK